VNKWDRCFLRMALDAAQELSKDPSLKVGALIVGDKNEVRSLGFNGCPRKVSDLPSRLERPTKLLYTVHAELNAILNVARVGGAPLEGCTLYLNSTPYALSPCNSCALAIIQAGITRVVYYKTHDIPERWRESCGAADIMFAEAHIQVEAI